MFENFHTRFFQALEKSRLPKILDDGELAVLSFGLWENSINFISML